ncbi:MAG: PLP-dependent aminotransferase family protein [Oceanipulchritudo sp.]
MKGREAGEIAYSRLGHCARRGASVITRLMSEKLARPEMLSLAAGFTDNRVLPVALVRRAAERLERDPARAHLQYGMNRGRPGLRREVVNLLRSYPGEESLDLDAEQVLVTNGSQQGLYLMVQMLCDPGDIVLVESPSYFVFLELLQGLGVQALSIPCDGAGRIRFPAFREQLEELRANGRLASVRLLYLMGAFANPSTRCLEEEDKRELAAVVQSLGHRVPVIEDMAYRELYFEGPCPARSMLAMPDWDGYPVVYAGTFTKPFATGLKVGFLASRDAELLGTLAKIKGHQDFGTAHFNQAIIEEVLRAGEYHGHLSSLRSHYRGKRDLLETALREHGLADAGWIWDQPAGGLLLWARGPAGTDTRIESAFHRACLEQEILYVPGDLCFAEGTPCNSVRLSFGAIESELIPEAARRFCAAARKAADLQSRSVRMP